MEDKLQQGLIAKGELHPEDKKYFEKYPAPIFELLVRNHYIQINHTTPFYGILLYSIIRAIQALSVAEIGVGYGWCSYFMAMAVKENMTRYQANGRYLAIDISGRPKNLFDLMEKDGLPVKFIQCNSLEIKSKDYIFENRKLDLIFQDGNHETKHCFKELDEIYPALKDNGNGYLICHDTNAWCEEYFKALRKDPRYKFEYISFPQNYGLTFFRNMANYDYDKIRFPLTKEMRENPIW